MKILIIGRGGREHALAWKSKQSPKVSHVYVAPGNAGMRNDATLVDIDDTDVIALADFAEKEQIDLTIIGPEASLVAGVADEFLKRNLLVWGPDSRAAQIEGSKDFAKEIMMKYGVATAAYQTFTETDPAKAYVEKMGVPIVIKADGLAAGKGVVIPETLDDAYSTIDDMLEGNLFGDASSRIVIEEFLEGEEFSLMTFVHNGNVYPMVMAQDHKRAYDNDEGPNTGGMGAYSPCFRADSDEVNEVIREVMQPVVDGLIKEGMPFTGFLYGGLILTDDGFKVIEFNARFGDPEAQVILPLLDSDLIEILYTILTSDKEPEIIWNDQYAVGVVIASEGYPDQPITGHPLNDPLKDDPNNMTFYAGVAEKEGRLVSNGGRILLAVGIASSFQEAFDRVYKNVAILDAPHTFHRKDIGHRQIAREANK